MAKPYHKTPASIDQADIIPFPLQSTTHIPSQPPKKETVDDYMWLIKLAEMGSDRSAIKSIFAEVWYLRRVASGDNPEDYIVPLMRILRDDHPFFYEIAKRFIERKYEECFPGQKPAVAPEVMDRLRKLAEGGAQ